jgi:hypothetical protein
MNNWIDKQCCRTVTMYYGSGSGYGSFGYGSATLFTKLLQSNYFTKVELFSGSSY